MDFSDWKVKFIIDKRRAVDNGLLHHNMRKRRFEIRVGTRPRKWRGDMYTQKDVDLITRHEVEHVITEIDGIVEPTPSWFMVVGEHQKELDRERQILQSEKIVLKRVFSGFIPETHLDMLCKAQRCLTEYAFTSHFSKELFKQ